MNIYYIDYENVNSSGLKGIQRLDSDSQVNILYSKKADNVKIEALAELMKSKAEIHFLPVHVGTPNALDFQLVTLLFLHYENSNHYYIISKDSGYDCCIKTAQESGAPNVSRFRDIESSFQNAGQEFSADAQDSSSPADTSLEASEVSELSTQENSPDSPSRHQRHRRRSSRKPAPHGSQTSGDSAQGNAAQSLPSQSSLPQSDASAPSPTGSVSSVEANRHMKAEYPQEASSREKAKSFEPFGSRQNASEENPAPKQIPGSGEKSPISKQDQTEAKTKSSDEELPSQTPAPTDQPSPDHREESGHSQTSDNAARFPSEKVSDVIFRRCGFMPDEKQVSIIRDVLQKARNKQQFYTYIVRRCGQKEGLILYHKIKGAYNDLLAIENR